jgi:ParB-like chromosome segregation protein Spo0J
MKAENQIQPTPPPAEAETEETDFAPRAVLERLRVQARGPAPADRPERLPLADIQQEPELFQIRPMSERHVSALVSAVRSEGELEPVTVIQVGPAAVLIDGHHRLAAYAIAGRSALVPVRYFGGTLEEAVAEAGRANAPAKLPMTAAERTDYAWRLVLLGTCSKTETRRAASVGTGTVTTMRKVKERLGPAAFQYPTWARARAAARGEDGDWWTDDEREEWMEQKANEIADRMAKALGTKLAQQPEITARALSIYFGRKLPDVYRELREHVPEDQREEEENPNF